MKRVAFMTVIAIFAMSVSLMAQNPQRQGQGPGMRFSAKERAEALAKQVELTDAQKAQVVALFEKQDAARAEQFAKMRDGGNQDREAMRAAMQKTMEENDVELEKIIGKEKMEKYKKERAERMPNMGGQGRRNGPRSTR
jgi:Spy/CpxP family protein refolding chaperone